MFWSSNQEREVVVLSLNAKGSKYYTMTSLSMATCTYIYETPERLATRNITADAFLLTRTRTKPGSTAQ